MQYRILSNCIWILREKLIEVLYSLDSKPPPESKPPVYNAFLIEKSFKENPFSKVSPWAYYPDYTAFGFIFYLRITHVFGFTGRGFVPTPATYAVS